MNSANDEKRAAKPARPARSRGRVSRDKKRRKVKKLEKPCKKPNKDGGLINRVGRDGVPGKAFSGRLFITRFPQLLTID